MRSEPAPANRPAEDLPPPQVGHHHRTTAPETPGGRRRRLDSPFWLLLLLPLFLTGLSMPVQSPDEPREIEIARGMYEGWDLPVTLDSQADARRNGWTLPADLPPEASPAGRHVDGSYVVPHLAGRPFLEKPPLYYWTVCAAFAVCGVNSAAARLPDALFGLLSCLLIYALLRRWAGGTIALLAAAILASMHRHWEFSHTAMIDMILVGCVTAGYYAYARWQEAFFSGRPSAPAADAATSPPAEAPVPAVTDWKATAFWSVAFWVAVGLSFLAKNAAGPVLVLSGAGIHLLYACFRSRRWLGGFVALSLGLPALALLIGPWLWLLYRQLGSPALHELLIDNNFGRFDAGYAGHKNANPFFYVDNFFVLGAPWTLLLPAALLWVIAGLRKPAAASVEVQSGDLVKVIAGMKPPPPAPAAPGRLDLRQSQVVLLLCYTLVPTIVLSLSAGKRGLYLLPMLPGQAALLGLYLAERHAARHPANGSRPAWLVITCDILETAVAAVIGLALIGALVFALAPTLPSDFFNGQDSRQFLPVMEFGAPSYLYLPFGLAALVVALAVPTVAFIRAGVRQMYVLSSAGSGRSAWRLTPPAWLALTLAVGLFFMGVNLGGLLDFAYRHKSMAAFAEACGRAGRGELFLTYCGEKERGILAWSSRGHHLVEEPHGQPADPATQQPSISLADVLQPKLDGPRRRYVMLPETTIEQLSQEFPTWRRHLFPTQAVAINDTWYWLLSNRADLPARPPATALAAGLRTWQAAADLRLLVHPTQAGFRVRLGDSDLPHIWNADDLMAWAKAHPAQALVVPEEPVPGAEPQPLDRIRAEWPLFDQTFRAVGTVTAETDLTGYTGSNRVPNLILHLFVAQPVSAKAAPALPPGP